MPDSENADSPVKSARAQRTHQRILDVATQAFFSSSYDDTTLTQIAEAAGVANGTVLLHFESKRQLATMAFAVRIAEAVAEASSQPRSGDVLEDLVAVVDKLLAFYRAHRDVAPELLSHSLFSSGEAGAAFARAGEVTISTFTSLIKDEVDEAEAPLLAQGLVADYLFTLLRGLRGEIGDADDQLQLFRSLASSRLANRSGRA